MNFISQSKQADGTPSLKNTN